MTDKFTLDKSIGYLINKTAIKLKSELFNNFKSGGFNITTEQWAVLACLKEKDGRTQNEIAEKLIKDKTNVSRILDGMQKKQLIERCAHESDRRSFRILITQKGKALVEGLIPIARRLNQTAADGLDNKDIRELERLMQVIYKNLA